MYAVKIDPKNPDKKIIGAAAKIIREGGLVVFPTETVYGIAANLHNAAAVDRLYRIKNREKAKPFTVHISDADMIERMGCRVTKNAELLISRFWPGPLTIILKSDDNGSIGFRMPANKIARDLIRVSGVPVVAPSANLSGSKPPTSAQEALKDLDGKIDMVLDAGKTDVGIESTVVDLTTSPFKILREGAVSRKEISKVING